MLKKPIASCHLRCSIGNNRTRLTQAHDEPIGRDIRFVTPLTSRSMTLVVSKTRRTAGAPWRAAQRARTGALGGARSVTYYSTPPTPKRTDSRKVATKRHVQRSTFDSQEGV